MAISKSKATTIALTSFLMLAMTIALVAMPVANAHDPAWKIHSYAYLVPAPNPVGVGQRVLIVMWVDTPMPSATVTNDIRRHDYKLTITDPDGEKEVMNWPVVEDPTSIQYVSYTPDKAGTYTMLFEYPQQEYEWEGDYYGDIFSAASREVTLTVQEEPLPAAKNSYPLPTEYWTRPIEGQNTYWYSISSNWLGSPYIPGAGSSYGIPGGKQLEGAGPNSAHVMWSRPIQDGGVVGGNIGIEGTTYYMGGSYNTRFSNALIMHGRLYYDLPNGNSGSGGGYMCVDLRTGETIWGPKDFGGTEVHYGPYTFYRPITPSFGYLFDFDDPNQHGVLPNGLLFTSNFAQAIEPTTGELLDTNITGVPSGTAVAAPKGEIIRYVLSNVGSRNDPEYRLLQWNSSHINYVTEGQIGSSNWYPGTIDASVDRFYDWNVSLSDLGPGSWSVNRADLDNIMLLMQGSLGTHVGGFMAAPSQEGANITAISLEPGKEGRILWTKHYDVAEDNATRAIQDWDPENGVFVMRDTEPLTYSGYSLEDGSKLWGPTEPTNDYTYFRATTMIAYGRIYYATYGGILYCYDVKNGSLLWTYGNGGEGNSTFAGLETSWGTYPVFVDVIADGKIYLATTEHSPGSPLYKDAKYRCVDAYTGEELWTLMGWGTGMDAGCDVLADGFFAFLNCYDMQIYCIGKGPSATSVSIQNDVMTYGGNVLVKGSVLDIAAGTQQDEQAARFPSGVPAVSDESMGTWMEYVYMQKPKPTDVVGVNVTLTVIDPNNNIYEVGTVTSDENGMYKCVFTPEVPGEYTVIATFAGSESFWPSHAATALFVEEAPEATPEPTPTPAPMTDTYVLGIGAGAIVAIIVVGLLLMMMLRRR